mgnify:CR=1 FL=1
MRTLIENSLVLASHNKGKIEEISKLLSEYKLNLKSPLDFNLSEPAETETTFLGNARIKAHYAAQNTNLPSLADDSGIEVDALNGEPGVYTADWAETEKGRNFGYAMEKLWSEIQKKPEISKPYKAQFCCTLVMAWPDGHDEVFEGVIEGQLIWPIRGHNGHGFDPMFQPTGYNNTFGEMNRWKKNKISHRGLAFTKLIKNCFNTTIKN